jgi:hypothetical protein
MKLYIIVNTKKKVQWHNLSGIADFEDFEGGYSVKSIKAFTKKKYAKEWIQQIQTGDYYHIRAVEVL